MSTSAFRRAIDQGVLVFDGAMGTEICRRHVFTNRFYDDLSLSDPRLVREIHEEYRDAGADFIIFETQPNRTALENAARAMRALPEADFALSFAVVDRCVACAINFLYSSILRFTRAETA